MPRPSGLPWCARPAPGLERAIEVHAVKRIRKAIFPVAGLGTRFLPATKSQPKVMLPLVDRPIIHYVVEEALGSGIETIIFVTGRSHEAIENYFDVSVELEDFLREKKKEGMLREITDISNLISP